MRTHHLNISKILVKIEFEAPNFIVAAFFHVNCNTKVENCEHNSRVYMYAVSVTVRLSVHEAYWWLPIPGNSNAWSP